MALIKSVDPLSTIMDLLMATSVIVNKLHRKKVVGRWSVDGQ